MSKVNVEIHFKDKTMKLFDFNNTVVSSTTRTVEAFIYVEDKETKKKVLQNHYVIPFEAINYIKTNRIESEKEENAE